MCRIKPFPLVRPVAKSPQQVSAAIQLQSDPELRLGPIIKKVVLSIGRKLAEDGSALPAAPEGDGFPGGNCSALHSATDSALWRFPQTQPWN
jgi:hypothetical protein